jgi:hypothetical protein
MDINYCKCKREVPFIQARRENHEVFSLVDERRASTLTFNVLANGFLACISNGAAEIAITPQRPFLPEMLFKLFFVSLPKLNGRFLFQSPHDSQWRDSRFAFHQAMHMILIHARRASKEKSERAAISSNNCFTALP